MMIHSLLPAHLLQKPIFFINFAVRVNHCNYLKIILSVGRWMFMMLSFGLLSAYHNLIYLLPFVCLLSTVSWSHMLLGTLLPPLKWAGCDWDKRLRTWFFYSLIIIYTTSLLSLLVQNHSMLSSMQANVAFTSYPESALNEWRTIIHAQLIPVYTRLFIPNLINPIHSCSSEGETEMSSRLRSSKHEVKG